MSEIRPNTVTALPSSDKPFGIAQIRAYIPVQLDLNKLNYDTWRELFETHCTSFGVIEHIDGSSRSAPSDEKQWKERDGLVKMWIYGTVSEQILDTILKAKSPARDVWLTIENLFRDNKEAQSLQYDNELRTLEIGDMDVTAYTHKLKSLSDLLTNLDTPVPDRALVMHMLNGLSDKFDNIINVIQHQVPFPTFTKARSMLLMEEKRLNKQVKPAPQHNTSASSPNIMYASQSASTDRSHQGGNSGRGNNYNNKNRGRGGRGNRGRGRYNNNQWNNQPAYPPWSYPQAPWLYTSPYGAPPPYSTPVYHNQAPPHYSGHSHQSNGVLGHSPNRPHEAHFIHHGPPPSVGSYSPSVYSALPHAFSTMSLQDPTDNPWVMDSGATNHIATQPGSANPEEPAPLQ